jgi:hypothetical protein
MGRAALSCVRAAAFACALLLPSGAAHASGAVERLLQILTHPSDPNVIVVRYGPPDYRLSNGLLFSKDGGNTFKAACSDLIKERLLLPRSSSPYHAAVWLDATGRLFISQGMDELFVGDTSGCAFDKVAGFETTSGRSIAADPADPSALYMLTYKRKKPDDSHTWSELMHRDASGAWTVIGPIASTPADRVAYGDDLLVARLPSGAVRMVVHYTAWTLLDGGTSDTEYHIASSDDGGKSWQDHVLPSSADERIFRLLALDPNNPDRVLALRYAENVRDQLLVSSDKGATYQQWAEVDQVSGVAFGADGRVFISGTNDSLEQSSGGLYTAAAIGEPLRKLPASPSLDCVHYRALDQKLFGCELERFGTLDANTGAFTPLTGLEQVPSLVACPGKSVRDLCEAQLNSDPSWCCAGHFPFTPFCGDYGVTTSRAGKSQLCGLPGRDYDERPRSPLNADGGSSDGGAANDARADVVPVGRDAAVARDAGIDGSAGRSGDERDDKKRHGCALSASSLDVEWPGAAFASLGLLLIALSRRFRKRT